MCPHKNEPQIVQAAEKSFAYYKTKFKKGDKTKDGNKGKGKRTVEFKDLDENLKKTRVIVAPQHCLS